MPTHYIQLMLAIFFEVIGTSSMQASTQLTKPIPTLIMAVSFVISIYFMTLVLKVMPVGIVYAIWSAMGIVLIAIVGYVVFNQKLDIAAVAGMGLIIAGVAVIHLFSNSAA